MTEQSALEQVVRAAVEWAHGYHMTARFLARRAVRAVIAAMPDENGHGLVRAFERRERLLEAGDGRVVQSGVEALPDGAPPAAIES